LFFTCQARGKRGRKVGQAGGDRSNSSLFFTWQARGKIWSKGGQVEEMEGIVSLLLHSSLLGRQVGKREEGRTCWKSSNPLLPFLILNRMLLSWQACRKRGRKGGHAGGAGIHCFFSLF